MNSVWEETWDVVGDTFRQIATSLKVRYPGMSWSAGHLDNEYFPFRGYAQFSMGPAGSEDVVTAVDFHRSEGTLRYTVDVSLENGFIVEDGTVRNYRSF
jgi:hypothetical protein